MWPQRTQMACSFVIKSALANRLGICPVSTICLRVLKCKQTARCVDCGVLIHANKYLRFVLCLSCKDVQLDWVDQPQLSNQFYAKNAHVIVFGAMTPLFLLLQYKFTIIFWPF